MFSFSATIEIIGVNPYVSLPEAILEEIFAQAQKRNSPIPVKGLLNERTFVQTLVKYAGEWRLYLNTPMRKDTNTVVGDRVKVSLCFDPEERIEKILPLLKKALQQDKSANKVFQAMIPSRQKEIIRYINHLKSAESIERNIAKTLLFLHGKQRHIGRDKP